MAAIDRHHDASAQSGSPTIPEAPIAETEGATIGRYKLLQVIGEGGFGIVYMAEQTEPVTRRVALKIIKLGMDTRQVIARFEAERQALAMMDHPNIAKVLDAGATDLGRPYFVMELVKGVPITKYCDDHKLSTEERLRLFLDVCHAIQHAHQKGIIHRDIKPSNILVTLHDGKPVPKVIDFGIAKATQTKLTDKTLFTRYEQIIGTPAYMSPEQAEMSGLDIDTRTDIYSLGVLLYELLTGATPFDTQQLLSAGLDEMRRIIREQEPVRPSTRLSTLVGNDVRRFTSSPAPKDAESAAQEISADSRRRLHSENLIKLLRRDLDWIVLKCLEKDRTRRYETAESLLADINRHLENEPVSARPPSVAYRFQKVLRRHRTAALASVLIVLSLFGGIVFSTTAYIRERNARFLAQQAYEAKQDAERATRLETLRADTVSRFMSGFFENVIPELYAAGNRDPIKRILAAFERLVPELGDAPLTQAMLHFAIAATYAELMWDYKPSLPHFRAAERLASQVEPAGIPIKSASHAHRLAAEMWDAVDPRSAAELQKFARAQLAPGITNFAAAHWSLSVAAEFEMLYGKLGAAETLIREALSFNASNAIGPGFGFPIQRAYPLCTLAQISAAKRDPVSLRSTSDQILALLSPEASAEPRPADALNAFEFAGVFWSGAWEILDEGSIRTILAANLRYDRETAASLQALLGVARARAGQWVEGLQLIRSNMGFIKPNVRLWRAEIQLAALSGKTNDVRQLLSSGLAHFASDADPRSGFELAIPMLILGQDHQMDVLTKLVSRLRSGAADLLVLAAFPTALLDLRGGRPASGLGALQQYHATAPEAVGHWVYDKFLGCTLLTQCLLELEHGDTDKARDTYRAALEKTPKIVLGTEFSGVGWVEHCAAELLRREAAAALYASGRNR